MQGSFLDILPPQAQANLGAIAGATALVGLVVWAAGIRIANISVSVICGAVLGALAAVFLPGITGLASLSCAIIGLCAGALIGALGFRLLQGLTLAVCLGLAVAGIYDRWHLVAAAPGPATTLAAHAAPVPVEAASRPIQPALDALKQTLLDRWHAIPVFHQQRMGVFSLAAAVLALLIAYVYPRQVTCIISALLGSLLLLAGTYGLAHVYAPQYERWFPVGSPGRYGLLAGLALAGMFIQYRFFWPKAEPAKAAPAPAEDPLPQAR